MGNIALKDNIIKKYPDGITVYEVAASLGAGLTLRRKGE